MKYMVGRVIRGIAVRALGPGLSCRRIVLHIDHQGGAFQIRARYLFANRQDVDRIVLLGFDASPSLCDVVVPSGFKLTPPAVSSALGSRVALGLTRSGVSERRRWQLNYCTAGRPVSHETDKQMPGA